MITCCALKPPVASSSARARAINITGKARLSIVEITKALAALKPLYGKDNIEVVTADGSRVRGVVRSMKTTQALTKPSVKIERADGEIVKIVFSDIIKVIDHNNQ
jgi:hypothetical protein